MYPLLFLGKCVFPVEVKVVPNGVYLLDLDSDLCYLVPQWDPLVGLDSQGLVQSQLKFHVALYA